MGHVMRCLALVEMLNDRYSIFFLIQNPSSFIVSELNKASCEVIILPESTNYEEEAKFIAQKYLNENSLAILDGYNFKLEYQRALKRSKCFLLYIDDLHAHEFAADVVLNHASGISHDIYSKLFSGDLLLGPQYALLRPQFHFAALEIRNIVSIQSAFVCMGGADPDNHILNVLKGLIALKEINRIDLLVGPAYQKRDELNRYIVDLKLSEKVTLHCGLDSNELLLLMKKSDMAICSASTISYEYCAVGGLLFVIKTADNQDGMYNFLINDQLALPFEKLDSKYLTVETCHNQQHAQRKYFDGKVKDRIQDYFYSKISSSSI